jgi:hypothetical protein
MSRCCFVLTSHLEKKKNVLLKRCSQRARGEGGISCTPSKDFEKLDHENAKNTKIEDPFPDFLTTQSTPL